MSVKQPRPQTTREIAASLVETIEDDESGKDVGLRIFGVDITMDIRDDQPFQKAAELRRAIANWIEERNDNQTPA